MFVTTFYSFKGGVGRTFALVNVGVELAQQGRRVLLVDMDLEAPGITTFPLLQPPKPQAGMVEYVSEFTAARASPDIRDFVYEVAGMGDRGGRLWVMPAGRGDDAFRAKLAEIEWARLYAERDGFFMMEDLKAQWRQAFEPDYVLVDSRTGYSDIHGICTRQLPDVVVVVFFPNEQNLAGLKTVVSDIRSEVRRTRDKPIKLVFVMSNVPDLDDEEQILQRRIGQFQQELRFREADVTIHRYDSLALLNQAIFTRERPNSRLAREYCQLKDRVVANNPDDRDSIVNSLRRIVSPRRALRESGTYWRGAVQDIEHRIDQILEQYSRDPEILLLVSTMRTREGRLQEAVNLLDRIVEVGQVNARVLLSRADLQLQLKQPDRVRDDLLKVMQLTKVSDFELARVVRFAHSLQGEEEQRLLKELPNSPAFMALDRGQQYTVVKALEENYTSLAIAVQILGRMLANEGITLREQDEFSREMARCCIGLRRFNDVIQMVGQRKPDQKTLHPIMAFHYGMTLWATEGTPTPRYFQRALEVDEDKPSGLVNPSFYQRQAIAAWAVGDQSGATAFLKKAIEPPRLMQPEFSYWRYLVSNHTQFVADCQAISKLISGEKLRPIMFDHDSVPDSA